MRRNLSLFEKHMSPHPVHTAQTLSTRARTHTRMLLLLLLLLCRPVMHAGTVALSSGGVSFRRCA